VRTCGTIELVNSLYFDVVPCRSRRLVTVSDIINGQVLDNSLPAELRSH